MKRCKRSISVLLAALLLAATLPGTALAAGRIDLTRAVALTVSYQDGAVPLSGAGFRLYLVATVDETGELTAAPDFQDEFVSIRGENDAAWRAQALALEGYALREQLLPADSSVTNGAGQLSFPTGTGRLTPGLYLLSGSRHSQNGKYYDPVPYLVLLPSRDEVVNDWVYQVDITEKADITMVPVTPEVPFTTERGVVKVWSDAGHEEQRPQYVTVYLLRDGEIWDTARLGAENSWRYTWSGLDAAHRWTVSEEQTAGYAAAIAQEGTAVIVTNTWIPEQPGEPEVPTDLSPRSIPDSPVEPQQPTLPQTGQLWWPVPVLLCAGLLMMVVGLLRRRGDRA